MAKRSEKVTEQPASELVRQFSAMGGYPVEKEGVQALAGALERSAMATGILMQAIVDECISSSQWCPTPYDIRQVAVSMKAKARQAKEGSIHDAWRKRYGNPDPEWPARMVKRLMVGGAKDESDAMLRYRIRCMLHYTEGEGRGNCDTEYWEGPRKDGMLSARAMDLRDHRALVDEIRSAGGWRTLAELSA